MKQLSILLIFLFPITLSAQISFEKYGLAISGGKKINPIETKSEDKFSFSDVLGKTARIESEAYFALGNSRFSIGTGLAFDYSSYKSVRKYDLSRNNEEIIDLRRYETAHASIPFNILFRSYQARSCVTFLTLGVRNNFQLFEAENFIVSSADNERQIDPNVYNNDSWNFQHSSTDIEMSFGNFWYVDNLNAQFSIEPKIILFSYHQENKINSHSEAYIHSKEKSVFNGFSFKIGMYKTIDVKT